MNVELDGYEDSEHTVKSDGFLAIENSSFYTDAFYILSNLRYPIGQVLLNISKLDGKLVCIPKDIIDALEKVSNDVEKFFTMTDKEKSSAIARDCNNNPIIRGSIVTIVEPYSSHFIKGTIISIGKKTVEVEYTVTIVKYPVGKSKGRKITKRKKFSEVIVNG